MKFVVEVDLDHRPEPGAVIACLLAAVESIEAACGSVESMTEKRFGVFFAGKCHDKATDVCVAQYGTIDETFEEWEDAGPVRAKTNDEGQWEKIEVPE